MTYLQAAVTVLQASEHPLTCDEIIDRIIRAKLVSTSGKTPKATLSAALYRNQGKHPLLRREAQPGRHRAARGTVRWYLAANR